MGLFLSQTIVTGGKPKGRDNYKHGTATEAYPPRMTNPEKKKKKFSSKMREIEKNISISDKLIIANDCNARVTG